jgi:hypothetical protein
MSFRGSELMSSSVEPLVISNLHLSLRLCDNSNSESVPRTSL